MKPLLAPLFASALGKLGIEGVEVGFSVPPDASMGDYATNVAMVAAKKLSKNPMDLAAEIVAALPENGEIVKAEPMKPGFINVTVDAGHLLAYFAEHEGDKPDLGKGRKAVTDTSHPNIAKPMGIHHLLSTVIGAAINETLAYVGYEVVRDNYVGDYGTQFGKLIHAYKTWGDVEAVNADPIPELLKLYVRFHDEAEKDPSIEDAGRAEFAKLEQGDPENLKLWEWIKDTSLVEFQKTWGRLGVRFDYFHGEAYYQDKLQEIIALGREKGVFVEGEKGALVCKFPDEILPTCVIVKGDGASLYHTRDLARVLDWERLFHPNLMVNVVDVAQELYFRQLFMMVEMLGLTKAENVHVSFGRMQFADRKMSTRKGNILPLDEVLEEAVERARALLEEKRSELPEEEKSKLAETIGIGSVKYAILSQNRTTNVTFDWDKIVSLEGNSAPYLQYTYARGRSVLAKAGATDPELPSSSPELTAPERAVLLHLIAFPEAVAKSAMEYRPNVIANELYALAQKFNHFYNTTPILEASPAERDLRLKLTSSVCTMLQLGLGLLGIQVPERM